MKKVIIGIGTLLVLAIQPAAHAERERQIEGGFGVGAGIYVPPPKGSSGTAPESEEARSVSDEIVMVNSDRLTGTLKGINEGSIHLVNPLLAQEVGIPLRNVAGIRFRKSSAAFPPGRDQVLFPDGCVLSGKLTTMDREKIVLETSYAGTLGINKGMVDAIILASEHGLVFQDDFSRDSGRWKPRSGVWALQNGKMFQSQQSSSHTAADVAQEGPMSYQWEIQSTQGYINGGFSFFSSSPDNMWGGNGYCVWVEGENMYLHRVQGNNTNTVTRYRFQNPASVSFRVEYDPDKGLISVWANSQNPVMNYTDPSPWKSGSHIILVSHQPTSFDNVTVMRGYGLTKDMKGGSETTDLVHLANGDRISGETTAISKDKIQLAADYGKISLDRKTVSTIVFNQARVAKAGAMERPGIVTFTNSDRLALEIQTLDDKVLSAESPLTGPIKIDRSALEVVSFASERK